MIRLGTRGSALALRQSGFVAERLRAGGLAVELVTIATRGDASDRPFRELEGKAFFTKELDEALESRAIDLAIHSLKDLPTDDPDGLVTLPVLPRADPRDLLLARRGVRPASSDGATRDGELRLPRGARVGTSSARRFAQLLHACPGIDVVDLRGNVPTRVEKLRRGDYDAIVLAAAGLERLALDLSDLDVVPLDPPRFLPAPGQGVLAARLRAGEPELAAAVAALVDRDARDAAEAERALLARLDGGCSLPLGALARREGQEIVLHACLARELEEGRRELRHVTARGPDGETAAALAAAQLLQQPIVLLTRPSGLDASLLAHLREQRLPHLSQPAIDFVERPTDGALVATLVAARAASDTIDAFDVIAFTSQRAVQSWFHHLRAARVAEHHLARRAPRYAAIGPATAAALAAHGAATSLVGDGSGGRAFAQLLAAELPRGARVLHPGPLEPEGTLARELDARGFAVTALPLYATVALDDDPELPDAPLVVLLSSPSAARAFLARPRVAARLAAAPASLRFVAGGATTAVQLAALQVRDVVTAALPTGAPLLAALATALAAARAPALVSNLETPCPR
ncbi:MAG: hydroxymethylbilane synthase [Planctomycetes bacterium]|nr:hydroxymethylbilane synthase [Planctomycetota bacterium]